MLYLAIVLATAVLLGMRHATDADHVLAVTTIASRERSFARAGAVGVLWGLGHTITVLAVGGAIVVFGLIIPPRVNSAFEMAVAVMLIMLGARSLFAARRAAPPDARRRLTPLPAFGVGIVHGLAGSAAAALLVVPLIHDARLALAYLLVFGVGTIAGMTLLTCAIAGSTMYAAGRLQGLDRWIHAGAGAMSLCFGTLLLSRLL